MIPIAIVYKGSVFNTMVDEEVMNYILELEKTIDVMKLVMEKQDICHSIHNN